MSTLPFADLETAYETLARAIDAAGPEKEALLLARLALVLAHECGTSRCSGARWRRRWRISAASLRQAGDRTWASAACGARPARRAGLVLNHCAEGRRPMLLRQLTTPS